MSDVTFDGAGRELELETRRHGAAAIVRVRGELDAYSAPALEELGTNLIGEGLSELVLDLAQTSFLDSSGLRAILTLHRRVEHERGEFAIGNPSDAVTRLLEITGLTDHFPVRRLDS